MTDDDTRPQVRVRILDVAAFLGAVVFVTWAFAFSGADFSSLDRDDLRPAAIGGATFLAFLMWVAAPFLGLLIVSRSLREQLSRFILWIGFLLMVGMGVKGFGKADDHAVHSLGFVIVPLLQLGVLLIASVVAFVLDRIVDQDGSP